MGIAGAGVPSRHFNDRRRDKEVEEGHKVGRDRQVRLGRLHQRLGHDPLQRVKARHKLDMMTQKVE